MLAIYADGNIYGGVQVLISRFSSYLRSVGENFVLILSQDAPLSRELSWANQIPLDKLHLWSEDITHLFVPHVVSLRMPLLNSLSSETKIFASVLHPTQIYTSFFPVSSKLVEWFGVGFSKLQMRLMSGHSKKVCDLLSYLAVNNGLSVMDGATGRGINYFYPKIEANLPTLPLTIAKRKYISANAWNVQSKKLSIGYLGRLDAFKWSALRPFIQHQIIPLSKSLNVDLHFVSYGDHLGAAVSLLEKSSIEYTLHGFMHNEKALETIRRKTDLAACMGTSALDLASVGHPCIIIDPVHSMFLGPQKYFRFVHEIDEFTVGEFRDIPSYKKGLHVFSAILKTLHDPNISKLGFEYVNANHEAECIYPMLHGAIMTSNAQFGPIKIFSKSIDNSFKTIDNFARRLYSLARIPSLGLKN